MAWWRTHKKPRPGQPISARDARKIAETADWISTIRADVPLSVQSGFSGLLIRYVGQVFGAYIGITGGSGISYRSGSTPGSGTVTLQGWNGTDLVPLGKTVTAFNISAKTDGIPSGKYCIILKIFGSWWIITVEC